MYIYVYFLAFYFYLFMIIPTHTLPSGYNYPFSSINVKPMTFAQILEYMENTPKNQIDKFYFDYCLISNEDPNVKNLLVIDMEYVIYMKKAITVSEDLEFKSSINCPRCNAELKYQITLSGINWNKMDPEALNGFTLNFGGEDLKVRMPTTEQFINIYSKYRMYKRNTDIRIIKLVALFEQAEVYHNKIERMVVNATYGDITKLFMLDGVFYDFVEHLHLHCDECEKMYNPTASDLFNLKLEKGIKEDEEIPEDLIRELKYKHGGIEIGVDPLVSNFFRDISINNPIT